MLKKYDLKTRQDSLKYIHEPKKDMEAEWAPILHPAVSFSADELF